MVFPQKKKKTCLKQNSRQSLQMYQSFHQNYEANNLRLYFRGKQYTLNIFDQCHLGITRKPWS